ncbi:MAG: AAA family ATPase, partial [Clostridia bacterium]|nr:AAA family ATPase [Clostridia bacterium]
LIYTLKGKKNMVTKYGKDCAEGQDLEKFFQQCGVKTEYVDGIQAPQEFRYNFSGGAYTDNSLKRAMEILNNMQGYNYEKNPNGGFTVTRQRKQRGFVGVGNCEETLKNVISADINGKQKGYICFGQGTEDYIITNFDECAHILVAGTTGSGKSVVLNSLAMQLLVYSSANLVMIDPKGGAEFGIYEKDIHNRIEKVCKDTSSALEWLKFCVGEMERRYSEMERKGLKKYDGERRIIVIDELADLMMTSKKQVEEYIVRIAQKGRASGIHLIVATQDPRASVVTGLIKYNLPTKVCLKTANIQHSMNVIDCGKGAELLDKGDSFIKLPNSPYLHRCQTCFVNDDCIRRLLTT